MGGRGLFEFEELQQTYLAIKDLDQVIASNSTTKLEDAWNVLAQINKDKFEQHFVDGILSTMREALLKIFVDSQTALNSSINVGTLKEDGGLRESVTEGDMLSGVYADDMSKP